MSVLNFQVGVDVGGTFTDIFVFDEKSKCIMTAKVPSTKKDQSEGFIKGISNIVDDFSNLRVLSIKFKCTNLFQPEIFVVNISELN